MDEENGVCHGTQAIWKGADAVEGGLFSAAGGVWIVRLEDCKAGQEIVTVAEMAFLIRERVAQINICLFCIDIARSFVIKASMNEAKFDALEYYRTSPLFSEAERAALDYVTELTKDKKVDPGTFQKVQRHYSEEAICEMVWLMASEHFYNITNLGLNIHSDMLCDIARKR